MQFNAVNVLRVYTDLTCGQLSTSKLVYSQLGWKQSCFLLFLLRAKRWWYLRKKGGPCSRSWRGQGRCEYEGRQGRRQAGCGGREAVFTGSTPTESFERFERVLVLYLSSTGTSFVSSPV